MRRILIATKNPGKIAELKALLDIEKDIQWLSLDDFDDIPEVVEDGSTFEQNSNKKALEYAKAANCWAIADDSGLVIDALDGQPGVKSARFSGEKNPDRSLLDHKNMAKVLQLMNNIEQHKRSAKFVCNITLASPDKILAQTTGTLEGFIAQKEIGKNGFGYDPIFYLPELKKTVAQLDKKHKNAISHRANAIKKLKPLLENILDKQ